MKRVFKIIVLFIVLLTLLYSLVTISFYLWASNVSDVIQIDFEGVTFNSPPGWVESRSKDLLRDEFGQTYILPSFQVGFRYHDQISINHLKQRPLKLWGMGWEQVQMTKTTYWQYVDFVFPRIEPGHDNAATLIRFINLEDQWYGIGYHTYNAAISLDVNKKDYGIPPQIMDSINSIRFVKKNVSNKPENSMDTHNDSD